MSVYIHNPAFSFEQFGSGNKALQALFLVLVHCSIFGIKHTHGIECC